MRFLTIVTAFAVPVSAHAHVGHVAEVAGHAHWIGLAAAAGAVVIGAWIARPKSDTQSGVQSDADGTETETETEEQTA